MATRRRPSPPPDSDAGRDAAARTFELVRRGKQQWEATFDALSEGIAIADDDARILRANAGFADLVGEPLPGVIGLHVCHTLFGEHHSLADLLAAAREGMRPAPLVRRSDRLGRMLRVSVAPIPSDAGAGSAVVALVVRATFANRGV